MSHWIDVDMKLDCTISQLQAMILEIWPEWKKHIQVSDAGDMSIYNPYETAEAKKWRHGFSIVIPGGNSPMGGKRPGVTSAPGLRYNDIGIKQLSPGNWHFAIDPADTQFAGMEGKLNQSLTGKRVGELVIDHGGSITGQSMVGQKKKIKLIVPADRSNMIQQGLNG